MKKLKNNTKPKRVDYFQMPGKLWRLVKKHVPKDPKGKRLGRPRAKRRQVINGIWYVLWTGCQWKAIHRDWFGVCSSVIHERFQTWQQQGVWQKVITRIMRFYGRRRRIAWRWQAIDSKSMAAPLGGKQTGKNPTDRAKLGSKIHILVDQRGAPLNVHITGANDHDKWSVDDLIVTTIASYPGEQQHLCADKAYDSEDIKQLLKQSGYTYHIPHRRRRGEPLPPPIPTEKRHPARRWVVERTLGWLTKRRSIRTRWSKKPENFLAFVQLACSHILCNLAFYG